MTNDDPTHELRLALPDWLTAEQRERIRAATAVYVTARIEEARAERRSLVVTR